MKQFLTILLILCAISIQAQVNSDFDKKSITDSCDKFMKLFQNGQPKESIKVLKNISVIGNESLDKLALQMLGQMDIVSSSYGEANSYQYIKEKMIGDFLIKRFYIVKFEKYYLKVAFTLYKNKTGWIVTNFAYNEDVEELF